MTQQMLKGGALPGLCALLVVIFSLAAGADVAKESAKTAHAAKSAAACTALREP